MKALTGLSQSRHESSCHIAGLNVVAIGGKLLGHRTSTLSYDVTAKSIVMRLEILRSVTMRSWPPCVAEL
jgi:hypothetical protein